MRKGLIAAIVASVGMLFSVAACNNGGSSGPTYEVTINNKTEMQAEWFGDGEARSLNLTIKKNGQEQNALEAIQDGDLKITSSTTTVATVQGVKVAPVDGDGGKSTITATYGDKSDSVEVTVTKANKHGKIASDPLTVAEAIAKCVEQGKDSPTTQTYFIAGVVTGITGAYSDKYGNMSFKIGATKSEKTNTVTVYQAAPATGVDYKIINKGSQVVVSGNLINYNGNTPEVNKGGSIVSATQGDTPQEIQLNSMADVVAATKALDDNDSSFDIYTFTGYIVNVVAPGTFYLGDERGEVAASQDLFEVMDYAGDNKDQLTLDAKVTVRATLKHYVSTSTQGKYQVETGQVFSVTILEPGQEPEIQATGPAALATIAAGTKYNVGVLQTNINKMLFADGKVSNNYLTTGKLADAAEFEVEETTGGVHLKTGTKYINLNSSNKAVAEDTAKTVWTWNADAKTLFAKSGDKNYYLGTYNNFNTFGASDTSYLFNSDGKTVKAGQFPIQFYALTTEFVDPTEIQLDQKANAIAHVDVTLAVRANPYNADLSKLSWSSSDPEVATVEAGVVSPLKAGETTITARLGNSATIVDTCVVTVKEVNMGTAEAPLTVAQAKAAAQELGLATGAFSPIPAFVKGTVEAAADMFYNGAYHGKWNLVTGEDKIYVVNSKDNTPTVYVGDEVVITGYLNNDGTNGLEFLKSSSNVYPQVIQRLQAATSEISVGAHEHATVELSATSGANGSEFTFTVTPDAEYVVKTVKVNGTAVEAVEGVYTGKVAGATTVTVETEAAGAADKKLEINSLGTGVSADLVEVATEVTHTASKITFVYSGAKKQGDSILLNKDKSAYIYNKTALAKAIKSIEVETNTGAAGACNYAVAFSASPITERTVGTNGYVIGAGAKHTYDCSVENALYFCITVSAKNGQVLNLVINYVD